MATILAVNFWDDCFSMQLSILGILLTLFTVILTIVISKKEELRIYSDEIKNGHHAPEIRQIEKHLINYISKLKKTNWILLVVSLFVLILFVALWLYRLFFFDNKIFRMIIICLLIIEGMTFFIGTSLLVYWYAKFIKR